MSPVIAAITKAEFSIMASDIAILCRRHPASALPLVKKLGGASVPHGVLAIIVDAKFHALIGLTILMWLGYICVAHK
jgi:hypothetical protein